MTYVMRLVGHHFSVGFWLDEVHWIESSGWFVAHLAQSEVDRLNTNLQRFKQQKQIALSDMSR
jgi:hypothetical protein